MDKPMPDVFFKMMSFVFKIRDFVRPRIEILERLGIQSGFHILDYGCGPGSYTILAAGLVGENGKVHALDIHPLALQRVQARASEKGLDNIETICSDCATGLQDRSVDMAFLFDIFHDLSEAEAVLKEIHRVLKLNGVLAFSDHHMKEDEIEARVPGGGLFSLSSKEKGIYLFSKTGV